MTTINKALSLSILFLLSCKPYFLFADGASASLFSDKAPFKEKMMDRFKIPHLEEDSLSMNNVGQEALTDHEYMTTYKLFYEYASRLSVSLYLAIVEFREIILNILESSLEEDLEAIKLSQNSDKKDEEFIDRKHIERELDDRIGYQACFFDEAEVSLENRLLYAPVTVSGEKVPLVAPSSPPGHGVITLPVKINSFGGCMSCLRTQTESDDANDEEEVEDSEEDLSEKEARKLVSQLKHQLTLPPDDFTQAFTQVASTSNSHILKFTFKNKDYVLKLTQPDKGRKLFDREYAALEAAKAAKSPNIIRMTTWMTCQSENATLYGLILPFYPLDLGHYFEYRLPSISILRDPESMERLRLIQGRLRTDDYSCLMVLTEALKGLVQLHALELGHSDVKEENFLMIEDSSSPLGFRVVLTDMGYSRGLLDWVKQGSPATMPAGFYNTKSILRYDRHAFGLMMARALNSWFRSWDESEGDAIIERYLNGIISDKDRRLYIRAFRKHCSQQGSKLAEIINNPYRNTVPAFIIQALELASTLMNTEPNDETSLKIILEVLQRIINSSNPDFRQ